MRNERDMATHWMRERTSSLQILETLATRLRLDARLSATSLNGASLLLICP
jgi:hypothetical protein